MDMAQSVALTGLRCSKSFFTFRLGVGVCDFQTVFPFSNALLFSLGITVIQKLLKTTNNNHFMKSVCLSELMNSSES